MAPQADPRPPEESVADVIERMHRVSQRLAPDDGVRAFNEMYRITTQQVEAALAGRSFADPMFMSRLDVVFAHLYLGLVDADLPRPPRTPRSWGVLIEARHRRLPPLHFALAGMNAHINYDLPRALLLTARELGGPVDTPARAEDFRAINDVLARTMPQVKQELVTGLLGVLDGALGNSDDRASMWAIERAREFAWTTARTLATVTGTPLAGAFTESLDRMVEMSSRLLLAP